MDYESLVSYSLKEYIPNTLIMIVIDYFKFQGKLDGSIDDSHKITNILLLPNQKILTYSFRNANIQLWSSNQLKICESSLEKVKYIELLLDGRIIIAFFGGLIKIFDPINWKFDDMEIDFECEIKFVKVLSKDMIYILLLNFDHTLILKKWNIQTNTFESIPILNGTYIRNTFFIYDEKRMIECLKCGTMSISNISSLADKYISLIGHEDQVRKLLILPQNQLASGSQDHTIKIWDMNKYNCIKTLIGHTNTISTLTVMTLPDNRLVSGSHDGTIKIWNWEKNCNDDNNNDDDDVCQITLESESVPNKMFVTSSGGIISYQYDNTINFWI